MFKILIVDDEPLVRAGIKTILPWHEHDFEVIGEAENGIDAYQKIITLKPDILITDIKMPHLDGIELLKKLKKEKINIQSIVLSCFDEFDLVREAMKYGARDYILKLSIEPDKILTILDEIKQDIAITDDTSSHLTLADHDLKYLFVRKLMSHGFSSQEQVDNVIRNTHFSVCFSAKYNLTLFRCLDIQTATSASDRNELIYSILEQICQRYSGNEIIALDEKNYLIIQNNENNEFLFRQISAAIKQYANQTVYFGQSDFFISYADFNLALQQASDALVSCIFYEQDSLLSYKQLNQDIFLQISKEQEQNLYISLSAGDEVSSCSQITALLNFLKSNTYLPKQIHTYLNELLGIFVHVAREQNLALQEITDIDIFTAVRHANTSSSCAQIFYEFTHNFINYFLSRKSEERTDILKIKAYVQQHYAEDIDLNTVADLVNITPSHLSTLFKKETGINFSTYLTNIRMFAAKKLLQTPDIFIYEVAEKCGYSNSSYFGKAFRKFWGISPDEFKSQWQFTDTTINLPSDSQSV